MVNNQDEIAVHNFREYLKIRSDHPNPDYDGCVAFLKKLGLEIGFKPTVINLTEDRPVLILTLEGELPDLPSILLNSHMDVVPVFKDHWDYDPFGAVIDKEGNIYGRGAQDMKCATIAEMEAIRRLKFKGIKLNRTIHMTILPDEEIGSSNGMEKFVETEAFKNLNIGFDIDEGILSTDRKMEIHKNERFRWPLLIHCPGTTGHSSLLLKDTAGEKARIVIERFMDFRKKEFDKFESGKYSLGEVTTVNITSLKGGIQSNVVPPEFIIGVDFRISADADTQELEKWLEDVCKEAGSGVYPEFIRKDSKAPEVCLENNPFWRALESVLKESDVEFYLTNGFAASDARFVRKLGIPVLGLSPFFNTESRIHGHNEYINRKVFLEGITRYEKIIESLANC